MYYLSRAKHNICCVDSVARTNCWAKLAATASSFDCVSTDVCAKCARRVSSIIERTWALSACAACAWCNAACAVVCACPTDSDAAPSCSPISPVVRLSCVCKAAIAGSTPFFLRTPAARGDVRPNADHWVFGERRPDGDAVCICRPTGSVTIRGSADCALSCCDTDSGYIGGRGKAGIHGWCGDPPVDPASLAISSIRPSCDIFHYCR